MIDFDVLKRIDLADFIRRHYGIEVVAGRKALCPFHIGHTPSLSVTQKNGVWSFKCFGADCGAAGSILDFVMLKEKLPSLTDAAQHVRELVGIPDDSAPAAGAGLKIVRVHSYTDKNGSEVWQKVKLSDGSFRCRRREGGRWVYNLKGVEPIPYRLHEIKDAPAVVVCEGEKDADTLAALGWASTSGPFGKDSWPDEISPWFKGKTARVVYDVENDGAALKAARKLSAVCSDIYILRVPLPNREDDVTDYLGPLATDDERRAAFERISTAGKQFVPELPEGTTPAPSARADGDEERTEPDALQKDYGHAAALAGLFRNLYRWAPHRESWMAWTGQVWRPVPEEAVAKQAADALRRHYAGQLVGAVNKGDIQDLSKKVTETCVFSRITAALCFLRGWPDVLTTAGEWDRDPWLFNVRNGTLDLRTGKLRPHDPADRNTKLAPVDFNPEAWGTKWRAHIERFLPNPAVRRQVQRDLGRALPGAVLEETLPIWHGNGANGKTTTARVLLQALGDYADRAAPNLLIQSKYERHPTEIADLAGLRLIVSVEVDRGKYLAEALVKELTGGDRKKGRFMRQDFFSFEQTFSIVLVVNHKPTITGTDDGIWRRIRLVPWEYRIPDAEKRPQEEVVAELAAEGGAVLNWLLDGLRDWQQDHRWTAPEVRAASDDYRAEMDVLGEFIADRCVLGPRREVSVASLYAAYELWCMKEGERPVSKRTLTRLLRERGIGSRRGTHNISLCIGIGLPNIEGLEIPFKGEDER